MGFRHILKPIIKNLINNQYVYKSIKIKNKIGLKIFDEKITFSDLYFYRYTLLKILEVTLVKNLVYIRIIPTLFKNKIDFW